jgi:hypothetical protein
MSSSLPAKSSASSSSLLFYSSIGSSTQLPVSTTATPLATATSGMQKCRINVAEFDDTDSNKHGNSTFSTNIYPASKDVLTNGVAICFRGAETDELTGVDIKCPPLGKGPLSIFNVRRDAGDVLRFIWGEQTWTAADKRCKLIEDWHTSPFSKV